MAKISITTHPTIAHLLAILILMLAAGGSFCASAYTMPADKLLAMSNKQLCDKAQSHWNKNELDSALFCFSIVANRANKKQSKEEMEYSCRALVAMANIYLPNFYDFKRAMQCILKAEQIALKNDLTDRLASIYGFMSTLEARRIDILHDFAFSEKPLNLCKKAFHRSVKSDKVEHIQVLSIINMITTALWYNKLDLIQNELQLFQSAIINDTVPARDFAKHQCAAAIYVYNQQYDSALNELSRIENCIDMAAEHTRPGFRIIAHENLYFVYRAMKDRVAALNELDIIEQIATETHDTFAVIEALYLKRDYYASLGNNALADKYDLEYHKMKDKFMADSKLAKVDEEKVLFKLNVANHEIKELSYKQRIQRTELIAVAVVALLMLSLLVLAWVNYRRTKQKNETLYQHNMQLMANEDRLRRLQQTQEQSTSTETVKYRRSNMEGDDIAVVMEKVDHVMESCTEIFSSDFTLDRLAELTGETRLRLSQAINKVPGRTFYSILNGYRVREACRRMDDKAKYSGLTIEAIGQSVGFKNRSSFVAIFKRITGVTPSAYFKQSTEPNSPTSEPQAD
jgi:AraC-like DNA-binding protein